MIKIIYSRQDRIKFNVIILKNNELTYDCINDKVKYELQKKFERNRKYTLHLVYNNNRYRIENAAEYKSM